MAKNLIRQLKERNLITQITNEKSLMQHIKKDSIAIYCGFDPTIDSLHLGHLVPLLCMRRFQQAGHKPILLVGGATGLIGDPSFKNTERKLHTKEIVQTWANKISDQIALFLELDCGKNSVVIVNNYTWFSNMNVLTFLRDIGKYFSVNQMINKESVKHRLNRNDHGISFTEFSYNILQGYDFAYLNKVYGVILQIGGSDQWGNITSGVRLTYRLNRNQVFGLTVPLITKSDGTKFGKTENDSVWLDPKKTSPYKFYQFWINTKDADVYHFLKIFTFIESKEIDAIEEDKNNRTKTYAQHLLAEQVTKLVHGSTGLAAAKRITNNLFNNSIKNLNKTDFEQLAQDGIPMIETKRGVNLAQVLVDSKLQPSRGQARKIIASHSITINDKIQINPEYVFADSDRLFGCYTVLRCGKKNYCLIHWK